MGQNPTKRLLQLVQVGFHRIDESEQLSDYDREIDRILWTKVKHSDDRAIMVNMLS